MLKKFLLIVFFLSITSSVAYAHSPAVTVLSWWSYFDNRWIQKEVEKICKVKLAVQSYKDANEFSESFKLNHYHIIIYELSQFKQVEKEISNRNILDPAGANKSYHPAVEKIYDTFIGKQNTAFFLLANTVFLYNPDNLLLANNDTITTIIHKLKAQPVSYPLVILDDPVTLNKIMEQETHQLMTTAIFKKLFNYKNLVISNDYINYKNLGAFFTWSGVAMHHQQLAKKQGIKLKILTLPRYSYVTADLMSVLSESKEAICVANLFSSQPFLQRLQENTFYYSPFLNYQHMKKSIYKNLYAEFERTLVTNQAQWILHSKKELHRAIRAWKKVVLDYGL